MMTSDPKEILDQFNTLKRFIFDNSFGDKRRYLNVTTLFYVLEEIRLKPSLRRILKSKQDYEGKHEKLGGKGSLFE